MRDWLRRKLPTEQTLQAHPSLRWLGPLLRRPWLWHMNRRRVALGAGIGVFFGFLTPVLQIVCAAMLALLLRANLPVAVFATFVSNPITYAPIGVAAYHTGAFILGEPVKVDTVRALETVSAEADAGPTDNTASRGWIEQAEAIGKPLFLGLAVFATVGGVATWASVHIAWAVAVRLKRRRRPRLRRA